MNRAELESRTVVQLKEMLRERGMKVSGRKSELIDRLLGSPTIFSIAPLQPTKYTFIIPTIPSSTVHQVRPSEPTIIQSFPIGTSSSIVASSSSTITSNTQLNVPQLQPESPLHVTFYDPKGVNGIFSNYWSIPGGFVYQNIRYPTSEHAFQAAKFDYPGSSERSKEYAKIISQQSTPNKARILALQKIGGGYKWRTDLNPIITEYSDVLLRPNWDGVKVKVMHDILTAKFTQCKQCQDTLFATGDRYIAEASPRDNLWGTGKDGTGQNYLGRLLMMIRDELRGQ